MPKNTDRRGLALGAIVALLSSLFVTAPAATADETGVVLEPYSGTSTTMVITEPFSLKSRLGSSVDSDRITSLRYVITKPAGYVVSYSTAVGMPADQLSGLRDSASAIAAASTTSGVVNPSNESTTSPNTLTIQVFSASAAITSVSPAVAVTVTAFLDLDLSGTLTASDPRETHTINFVTWATGFSATAALNAVGAGDDDITGSSVIDGAVNYDQLNGDFSMVLESTNDVGGSESATLSPALVSASETRVSHSAFIAAAVADQSVSALVYYNDGTYSNVIASAKVGVGGKTIQGITVSGVAGDNLRVSGATTAEVRTNAAFAFDVWPYSGSKTASVAVAPSWTIATTNVTLSNDKYMVIEGVKYTSSSTLPTVSKSTLPAGKTRVDVSTYGFSGNETAAFTFTAQNETLTYTLDINAADITLEDGDSTAATKPGTAISLDWNVEDQFGKASSQTNHRVIAHWVGDSNFSASASASYAVAAGKATVTATPSPATATGSTTLRVTLQTQDLASGLWNADETEEVTIVVSSLDGGFTSSAVATRSASISYAIADGAFSWSGTAYSGTAAVGGQDVVISGTSLFFKDSTGVTGSGTLTVRAGSDGAFTFYAASGLAGTHTISMTAGGSSTTSLLVVSPALHDAGKSISIDKTEILAGSTTTITGTLTDANGNPVATGTTASILVKWTGKGLPFNMPTSTDADGEFEFQVLALSSEIGDAAVSVTYMPTGSSTYTKNITSAYAVDIVSSLTEAAAAQKITVGTFKGYVAIYTKGYMGQKLSAKVAGKWLVVDPIAAFKSNDYSRTVRLTGAGYTITVDLYIDGVFVRSEVVTTK